MARPEPYVTYATVRESEDDTGYPCWDIECRFSDGQKYAAIEVAFEFEKLADFICGVINLPKPQLALVKFWIEQKQLHG